MVFQYYYQLNAKQKAVYKKSDRVSAVKLKKLYDLRQYTQWLKRALEKPSKLDVQKSSNSIAENICKQFEVPRARVIVLSNRPHDNNSELLGLYEPLDGRKLAKISVWMRTAQRHQVVAFRTFLRTLLHEICHHLDYEYFKFEESYHTEGFYKRENSIFNQIVQ